MAASSVWLLINLGFRAKMLNPTAQGNFIRLFTAGISPQIYTLCIVIQKSSKIFRAALQLNKVLMSWVVEKN